MTDRVDGERGGARRAPRARRPLDPRALAVAGVAAVALAAWGLLVWSGIRFGQSARGGDGTAWIFMAIASLGAVACLFLALVLGIRTARLLGWVSRDPLRSVVAKGGKRRR